MTRISRATLIIIFFFGLEKVASFVRQNLATRLFTSNELDIFLTSNNIPDLLSALISGGALGMALLPIFAEMMERQGRPAAWGLFSRIVNLAFLVTAALAGIIIISADPLVRHVIAPGFDPAKQALTASLMRLDLGAIMIFSVSGLVMASLQANQHFILPAMSPLFYNIGQIVGLAILVPAKGFHLGPVTLPAFGLGLYGMVGGVILGALLHLAIQIPGLFYYQFRWTPSINVRYPGVARVLWLLAPRMVSMFFLQAYFLARDNFASHLPSGSVTMLNFGWFLMQVPETLIGTSIAIALLPSLAEYFVRREAATYGATINRVLRTMLALMLPVAAILAVCIRPIVEMLFKFSPAEYELLSWTIRVYFVGMVGHAWVEVGVRSWLARQNASIPFLAAFFQIVAYIPLAWLLSQWLGVAGLALADASTFTAEALLLLFLLNSKNPGIVRFISTFRLGRRGDQRGGDDFQAPGLLNVTSTLVRTLLGSAAGALVAFALMRFLPLAGIYAALAAVAGGGLACLPFIWPEIKGLIKL